MYNRRQLRIKVLQVLYGYYRGKDDDLLSVEREALHSVERVYDLYLLYLLLIVRLKDLAQQKIERGKEKVQPTEEDLNPNTKFVDNEVIVALESTPSFRKECELRKIGFSSEEEEIVRRFFKKLISSDTFQDFMNNGKSGVEEDVDFVRALLEREILLDESIELLFEERSIYWIDDHLMVSKALMRTLGSPKKGGLKLEELHKDEKDEIAFVKTLLRETVKNDEESDVLIDELLKNWDVDRLAVLDRVLLRMGVTELQVFPSIPKKVTLNEYIEIAKDYCMPKSASFVNGLLDKATAVLTEQGKIKKTGRGLIE